MMAAHNMSWRSTEARGSLVAWASRCRSLRRSWVASGRCSPRPAPTHAETAGHSAWTASAAPEPSVAKASARAQPGVDPMKGGQPAAQGLLRGQPASRPAKVLPPPGPQAASAISSQPDGQPEPRQQERQQQQRQKHGRGLAKPEAAVAAPQEPASAAPAVPTSAAGEICHPKQSRRRARSTGASAAQQPAVVGVAGEAVGASPHGHAGNGASVIAQQRAKSRKAARPKEPGEVPAAATHSATAPGGAGGSSQHEVGLLSQPGRPAGLPSSTAQHNASRAGAMMDKQQQQQQRQQQRQQQQQQRQRQQQQQQGEVAPAMAAAPGPAPTPGTRDVETVSAEHDALPSPTPASLLTPAAAALLETLGLTPEQVADVATAAAACLARAGRRRGRPLDESEVRTACTILVDGLGLKVSRLPGVLLASPEVLVVSEEELNRRVGLLRALWGDVHAPLLGALGKHPELLNGAFFTQLGPCLEALLSLGFSRRQACRVVTTCPPVVHSRRYELASAINHTKLDQTTPETFALLARYPGLMMPGGCQELQPMLALLGEFGLAAGEALGVLAECPKLVRTPSCHVRSVVNLLRSSGFKQGEVQAIIRGWPPVLAAKLSRVRAVLLLLRASGMAVDKVVAYPRVFYHDPANYTAPRLAYLKAYRPERAEQLALASILTQTDAEFAEIRGKTQLEEYLIFKDRWLSMYGGRFGLSEEQAKPLQDVLRQQLAKEVSEQLYSPINWDSI